MGDHEVCQLQPLHRILGGRRRRSLSHRWRRDGNPYLDDRTYVDFAFIVNGCTRVGSDLSNWRDACEVTLTDPLPKYTDKDGVERIAVFDADKNPGWTLSADGASASKTYTGTKSSDVLTQIYNDELLLRFPGLKFDTLADQLSRTLTTACS